MILEVILTGMDCQSEQSPKGKYPQDKLRENIVAPRVYTIVLKVRCNLRSTGVVRSRVSINSGLDICYRTHWIKIKGEKEEEEGMRKRLHSSRFTLVRLCA